MTRAAPVAVLPCALTTPMPSSVKLSASMATVSLSSESRSSRPSSVNSWGWAAGGPETPSAGSGGSAPEGRDAPPVGSGRADTSPDGVATAGLSPGPGDGSGRVSHRSRRGDPRWIRLFALGRGYSHHWGFRLPVPHGRLGTLPGPERGTPPPVDSIAVSHPGIGSCTGTGSQRAPRPRLRASASHRGVAGSR